ncbi:MAG: glycosyl hydrolase 2 galactose-binding domain-containing protein, partial [Gemmatimonadales bacterium]
MTSGAGGRGRVRGIAGYELQRLTDGWEMALAGRDALDGPRALESAQLEWIDTCVPSTVAAALRGRGLWSLDGTPRRFDAEEWWYRTTFRADPATGHEQLWLCFDGLATVADAWLNGTALLSAAGMFTAHE